MNRTPFRGARRGGGYALITAIIFLVLLTLVALSAIRGTGLEVKSAANNVLRTQAFESSESARTVVGPLIDLLCYNGGWPASIGGTVANADFNTTLPPGLSILNASGTVGGTPNNWCLQAATAFDPNPAVASATVSRNTSGDPIKVNGVVSVRRLYMTGAVGGGQGQASGYAPPGISVAGSGGNIYFHVQSRGNESASNAEAGYNTSAIYRYVIRR